MQDLADKNTVLEQRLATLEQVVAELQATQADEAPGGTPTERPDLDAARAGRRWPHMFDNIVLGLMTLLAAHWLTTLLPIDNRAVFRLVGFIVALPFGYRFQWNSRSDIPMQIVAAVAFGSLGTILNGVLDLVFADHRMPQFTATDVAMSVVAVTLSHYAGSALAAMRQAHTAGVIKVARSQHGTALLPGSMRRLSIEPARIKTAADVIKALYDAVAPLVAGAAALWAAVGHIQF